MAATRTSHDLDLALTVDRQAGRPLRAQVESRLRDAIRSGRLAPRTALPSSRALARDLGLSRGVVVEVYAQLAAEGYLKTAERAGTRVAAEVRAAVATARPWPEPPRYRYDFRVGVPDVSLFPRAAWAAALGRAVRDAPDHALLYGDPRGARVLRAAVAAYVGRVRGVVADPERIVIGSGFHQGLGLLCRVLRERGVCRIAVENPGSLSARAVLTSHAMALAPVPVDDDGLRMDALAASDARVVVLAPAHQLPTATVLSAARRAALVRWARERERDALIVEDDYNAEYRYDREPVGAVQGLAPEHVVYSGSASKTLAPALRIGWYVLPAGLMEPFARLKGISDHGSPTLDQIAFAELLESGALDRHLRRARASYRARRDALVAALACHLPAARVRGVAAGLHLVVELPPRTDEAGVVAAAARRSVGVAGMRSFCLDGVTPPPALVVGYGGVATSAISGGVTELVRAVVEATSGAGHSG